MLVYILALLVVWIIWKINSIYHKDPYENFSTTSVPLMKNSFNMMRFSPEGMFSFVRECAKRFGQSYQHESFGFHIYGIIKARDAEKVLNSSKHMEKGLIYNFLHPFLKTGLLTSKGDKWHTRRRMLTPAFHFDILKEFLEVFREESDKLVAILKNEDENMLNIIPISTQFTLNTICESAMGVKLSNLGNDGVVYRNNIYEVGKLLLHRLPRPWLRSDFLYKLSGEKAKLDMVLVPVLGFTKAIIQDRQARFRDEKVTEKEPDNRENVYFRSKKRRYAMMDTLLKAQQEGLIDDEGIIEETDTFTFEGHDTTSAAMTFTLLLMAHHPEAQDRIFEEIQDVKSANSGHELTIDDFNKMEYLDRVIKESLRIYPPVPFISRLFSEDFVNNGVTHKKGSTFQIHIFDIHRDPEVFPDPEKFDPDRYLPENCVGRSNFAFIAFSAGMRNCIGQRFALLELKIMLTKIIENFKISPVTSREEIVFIADLILRSKDPIKMKFLLRN